MKLLRRSLIAAAVTLWGGAAMAQPAPPQVAGFTVPVSTAPVFGVPLSMDKGPWVVGEALFQGQKEILPFVLRNRIRADRGALYTPSDISRDLSQLNGMPTVVKATAELYGMPDQPVPESYRTIAISTMMVRIVYRIEETPLALPGLARAATTQVEAPAKDKKGKKKKKYPPSSVSGVVMTPTAYRGIGRFNRPGMGLDVNAVYFIGRLYGKNTVAPVQTNYIDRLGVWFLSADGKMQIQSETKYRPAMAVGLRGILTFRDAPQPSVNTPTVQTEVTADTTRKLSDVYLVASKNLRGLRSSLGYAHGAAGDRVALLTEFLSPESLKFHSAKCEGYQGNCTEAMSKSVLFGSLLYLPKPHLPLAVEVLKPNGMILDPILINLKIGYFLKMNFDLAFLVFDGGWDMLGMFQFRYSHFPRPPRSKKKKKKR